MKKKILVLLCTILFTFSACGSMGISSGASAATDMMQNITVSTDGSLVTLTVPKEYMEEASQTELDKAAQDMGVEAITLNEDGSATYIMTEAQHEEMLADMYDTLNETLTGMIGSAEYPSFSSVTANEDFTKFMVTTISTEYGSEEELATMALYMVSGIYHIFKGEEAENVHIDFVNLDSNETIYSCDSSAMAGE